MKRIFVLLTACILLISFTACKKSNKAVSSKGQVTQSTATTTTVTTSTENTTQSKSEGTTLPTTQSVTTSRTDPSQVTQVSVTQKKPTTTAPKVTQKPQTTTTAPTKQLIVPNASQCAVIENEVMRLVNQYRVSLGIAPYGIESKIIQGARIRAKECSTRGNFGHIRPDGTSFSTVFAQVGYSSGGASAENLAGSSAFSLHYNFSFSCSDAELKAMAKLMFDGWKASDGHNRNMINTTRTKMGVGIYATYETTLQGDKDVAFYGIQLFTLT